MNSIAIGAYSGNNNQLSHSIAIGTLAGNGNQQQYSVAIGYNAGQMTQGNNSVAIGNNACVNNQGAYSIGIGNNIHVITSQASQSIVLNASTLGFENATQSGFYVSPIRGSSSTPGQVYYDTTTNEITYLTSSIRYKKNVIDLSKDTSVIYGAQPREYDTKSDKHHIGFIAEELEELSEDFIYRNEKGETEGIVWNNLITYMIAEMKNLKQKIEDISK